jgi:hypothetical protein
MKPTDNPCYECVPPKRKIGCHSTCKKRKVYLQKYHAEKKTLEDNMSKDRDFNAYSKHKASRLKGRNHEQ